MLVLLRVLWALVAVSLVAAATVGSKQRRSLVLITGSNSGVGLAAVKQLAALDEYDIVMACRSLERAEAARKTIQGAGAKSVSVAELDLADFASIERFCSAWGKNRPIDVLCLNAGIQLTDNKVAQRTKQGFEATVGTNHIGHWLLVNLLMDNVKKSPEGGKIIWTGSGVHNPEEPGGNVGSKAGLGSMRGLAEGFLEPICMIDGSPLDGDKAYKDSKLCNHVTTIEIARRLKEQKSAVTCNSFNPGLIPTTGLFRGLNPFFVAIFTLLTRYVFKVAVSEEQGGERLVKMITDPIIAKTSGGYYSANSVGAFGSFLPVSPSREAQDPEVGAKLWFLTEKIVLAAKKAGV